MRGLEVGCPIGVVSSQVGVATRVSTRDARSTVADWTEVEKSLTFSASSYLLKNTHTKNESKSFKSFELFS